MTDRADIINDYLFGDITEEQRSALEREIAADPQLAAEIADLAPVVSRLEALPDDVWEAGDPPPLRLGERAPARAEATPANRPEPARESFFKRFFGGSFSMRPAYALAAFALIFAGGLATGLLSGGDNSTSPLGPTIQQASLSPVGQLDRAAAGTADVKHDGQVIRLKINGLAANGDHDFYEAWLMDPKNGFISIGTFRVGSDGSTTLDLPIPVGTDRFPVVDISLQPTNGKPTHSGVSVLRGTLQS